MDQYVQGLVFQYGKSQRLAVNNKVHWFSVVEVLLLVYENCSWKFTEQFPNYLTWEI